MGDITHYLIEDRKQMQMFGTCIHQSVTRLIEERRVSLGLFHDIGIIPVKMACAMITAVTNESRSTRPTVPFVAGLPSLPISTYRLRWETSSTRDGCRGGRYGRTNRWTSSHRTETGVPGDR